MIENERLTGKQLTAIAALLSEPTIQKAAKSAGVSDATIWRWLQDRTFLDAYHHARRQAVDKATAELQAACVDAVATLKRNLNCGDRRVETASAKIILDQATKGIELADLVEEVERIKTLIEAAQAGKGKKWA